MSSPIHEHTADWGIFSVLDTNDNVKSFQCILYVLQNVERFCLAGQEHVFILNLYTELGILFTPCTVVTDALVLMHQVLMRQVVML